MSVTIDYNDYNSDEVGYPEPNRNNLVLRSQVLAHAAAHSLSTEDTIALLDNAILLRAEQNEMSPGDYYEMVDSSRYHPDDDDEPVYHIVEVPEGEVISFGDEMDEDSD
jgi:hypothetical protein